LIRHGADPIVSAERESNENQGGGTMADLVFVGLTLVFFGLSWALVDFCDRL